MNLKPTKPQFRYLTANAVYPAFVAGFGSGKTETAVTRAIIGKLRYPKQDRGFYEPTYDLIRMIAFPRFEEILSRLNIPYRLYKTPLNYLEIENHGKIFFRSMDTPSRIIGYEHADADVDELDTLKPDDAADVWRRILSRNRQNKPDGSPNTIGVTTTPEGFRFVYNTWVKNKQEGYEIIKASTSSNPYLPSGYVDSLKAIYPDNLLSAYLEGEFTNLTSGTVYHKFDRALNASKETIQQGETLYIGMDFNVQNMSAITHVKRGNTVHAVDELVKMYDTNDMIAEIKRRYVGHNIRIYPDASGGNRKTVNASETDLSLLRQSGFSVLVNPSNPRVRDRVNAMNAMFCNGNGDRRYFINQTKCPEYVDCLEQQAWTDKGEPDKASGKDHANDAGGYFICYDYPITKPVSALNVRIAI